jgi:hypothetical protein
MLFLVISNFILIIFASLLVICIYKICGSSVSESSASVSDEAAQQFDLLSPSVAHLDFNEFMEKQKNYQIAYFTLKEEINDIISAQPEGFYGVYFENLQSGSWFGINEKEKFVPGSLLKVPIITAVMKKVQDGDLTLNTELTVRKKDLAFEYGSMAERGYGYNLTILELLNYSTYASENTAVNTLSQALDDGDIYDALYGLGFPVKDNKLNSSGLISVSPKVYSNFFRSLYLSSYLKRPSSQLLLSLMASTKFNSGIPSGVPKNVMV